MRIPIFARILRCGWSCISCRNTGDSYRTFRRSRLSGCYQVHHFGDVQRFAHRTDIYP